MRRGLEEAAARESQLVQEVRVLQERERRLEVEAEVVDGRLQGVQGALKEAQEERARGERLRQEAASRALMESELVLREVGTRDRVGTGRVHGRAGEDTVYSVWRGAHGMGSHGARGGLPGAPRPQAHLQQRRMQNWQQVAAVWAVSHELAPRAVLRLWLGRCRPGRAAWAAP